MRSFPILIASIILLFTSACTTASEDDKLMEEAFSIHQESMQIAKETKDLLASSRPVTANLQSIRNRLKHWEDNLIEVPGFEHEHNHDHNHSHDHDHSHGAELELLPADMLAIQKEFLDSIRVIQNDLTHYRKTL